MNINQLESYNLADAVKFHDNLNPLLWDRRENLHPEIHDQLMAIAADFGEFLGVKDLDLTDITISGSNAAYSYTPHSDIDLHLVVDLSGVEHEDVYRELFTAKKAIYNKENTITIKGIPVEVYVQDATQEHHSQGIYSILNSSWIQIPRRTQADIDDVSVRSKYQDLSKRIKNVIKTNDLAQMNELMDKIRLMRNTGLSEKGEYGPENLAFKLLRNTGDLKKLQTARQAAKDQELSLKERVRTSAKYGYGKDYIEEVGLTPDGTNPTTSEFTNESQLDEVGLTPDGTNPTTAQFANETKGDHKSTIKNFMEFCADQLGIDKDISLRIRRDPQWSVRNKTFGRYNDGTNELEVGIGGRHIMDVLRTVAHELVHQKQNQDNTGPADAGEDGSEYENEANARAGVLMRQYGKLHPELFAKGLESTSTADITETEQSGGTRLKDLATVATNMPDADFWLIRKGSDKTVGTPVKEFEPSRIGVKIVRTDVLDPNYLYYAMMHLHNQGYFARLAVGTLKLVNIKVSDVANISFGGQGVSEETEQPNTVPTPTYDYPTIKNGEQVSGLDVGDVVHNRSSLGSSGIPYENVLPGIRRVPLSAFEVTDPNRLFYAANDIRRTEELAREIQYNNRIDPLIVVIDEKGPYILEGAHRLGALHILGAKELPAIVAYDEDVMPDGIAENTEIKDANSDTERRDKLKSLLRAGKDRGYIFQKEISTAFPEITTDDISSLSDQFEKMGIVVYTHEPEDNDSKPAPTQTKISGSISTSTPEFKKWFAGSKVVDADGNPLRVYHAAPKGFEGSEFKPPKVMANNGGNNPSGYYFSPRLDDANMYVKHHENTSSEYETGAQIIPAYLSIKNPYIRGVSIMSSPMSRQYHKELIAANQHMSDEKLKYYADSKVKSAKGTQFPKSDYVGNNTDALKRIIEAGGFDGILDGAHWVAFYPNQIKSVFNQKPSDSNNISTEGLNESAGANTVTRIDSKPIKDFGTGLQTYYHTPDWSQSGQFPDGEKIPKKFSGKVTGLYAGDPHFTALYATGNANQTRYVAKYSPGQPIVYLDRKDIPRIRKHRSYLSVFDATNFKKMPSGEYFSENPGNPIEQTEITDPFQYMRDQGWEWKIVDDLTAVLKKLKKEKAKYGAEGMGFAESRINEASGYIPTAAEAHDPRFEMALTVDVRPGALGKAANSFLLNTDSQGHPQELRPDGLVQRMTEALALFKKKEPTKLTENKLKFSREKLDDLLNDLCEKVMKGQEDAPDFYGMVAAAVIDPTGRLATGLNYLYGNQRIHAERDAIDNYEKEFGKLPSGCVVVTTLSPCNQDTGDIKEVTCTEVLNSKHVKIAYCGYMDPTQHREDNDFRILVTKNKKLEQKCKELADTFLKKHVKENINIKEDITKSKAQQFIDNVYSQYLDWPYGQADKVMVWGEGENQQFAAFKLKPKPAIDDNTVEIDWIMAGPEKRQGVGSRAIKELQRQAQESGIKLTLYPWDKGIISQAALTRFYKRQGFKPIAKGAKPMRWEPTLDELKIDNVNGLGNTSNNQNIAYMGLNVLMKPSTFLKLALPLRLNSDEQKKIDYIKKELDNRGIGAPFLQIDIPEDWEKGITDKPARVVGHDGRHRMMAIQSAEGDTPVEVHLFPRGYRNRDFKAHPEWIEELNNGLINESGQYMSGPFFQGGVTETAGIGINVYEEEEDTNEQLPSVNQAKNLLPMILPKIQKAYDDWDEIDVDTYAGGGICHILADAICDVLGNNGIECTPVSSSHEQHVYVAGKFSEGIYIIDIPYHIYETGGGFSWKKIPNITFETGDVTFYRASSDPADWKNYTDEY